MTPPDSQPPFPTTGRLAGIDFGTVRIGVAVTDPSRIVASPLETYRRANETIDAAWFCELVRVEQLVGFVVGLPLHTSGDESEKSREARQFGAWLQRTTDLPVCFFDERFTTVEADRWMGEARLTRKKKKTRRDMLAAQIMLAAFIESAPQSPGTPAGQAGPLDDDPRDGSGT